MGVWGIRTDVLCTPATIHGQESFVFISIDSDHEKGVLLFTVTCPYMCVRSSTC